MKNKNFLVVAIAFAAASLSFAACTGDNDKEFAPYKGRTWHAPHNADTLCLELTTASEVQLSLKSTGEVLALGSYNTLRAMFEFSDFAAEISGVKYRLRYARFTPQLNMVFYGDSLNTECDTAFVAWSRPFAPTEPYTMPNAR